MPPVIKRRQRRDGSERYVCPHCGAIHHWPADRCHRVGCGYTGKLRVSSRREVQDAKEKTQGDGGSSM